MNRWVLDVFVSTLSDAVADNLVESAKIYAYDHLNRLTNMDRGNLNVGKTAISGTPTVEQDWTLDPLGNWNGFTTKSAGTTDLSQTRSHSKANEISSIGETIGSAWVDPVQDQAGNMTTMPGPTPTASLTATYDAWNRMKTASVSGGASDAYSYDGLGRRIRTVTGGTTRDTYYSGWRIVTEQNSGASSAQRSYVWGLRYIDELVRCVEDGTSTYALQDANFNVTALVSETSTVQERYSYTPYGKRTAYNAAWTATVTPTLAVGHQGLFHDTTTGLIYNRARYLHPMLGRFTARDPLGYVDGTNAYESCCPITETDHQGTDRYRGTGLTHEGCAVDTWAKDANGNWVKTGAMTYDFSAGDNWLGWAFNLFVVGPGKVTPSRGINLGANPARFPSTPEQDIFMKAKMDFYVDHPPLYGTWIFNCRDFADAAIRLK